MSQKVLEFYEFGGVDSRSNALNMPSNRSLRCKNFTPLRSGVLQLRWGYGLVPMDAVTATPIHSLVSLRLLNDARYLVFGQGTNLKRLDLGAGHVIAVTIRGAAIANSNPWSWAFAKNMLHGANGTNVKMIDANGVMRDNGLPVPVASAWAGVSVTIGAANANGVPASTVGGAQPGYQFYAAVWNRVTNHVSNRIAIGNRVAPSVASNINITGLPNFSGTDTEWDLLIGRTDDGGEVPYPCCGGDGAWLYVPNGTMSVVVAVANSDQTSEMPTRNSPPSAFDKIVRVGSRLMGVQPNSPYIYWTESETDAAQSQDYNFVGDAAECWPANNVETFQTGAAIVCVGESSGAAFVFSKQDMGILDELSGVMGWEGTWQCGAAGWEAFVNTPYGPYWLTGNKQLACMSQSGPQPVSDEYEANLLARIGDQYLSQVQVRYYRDSSKLIDQIVIKAKDANGNVFRVIHDFTLKDSYLSYTYSSSPVGQGYEDQFQGPLANDYTLAQVRDGNDHPRLYAGAQDGNLYELYSGSSDAGLDYQAEYIGLLNAGPERPLVPYLEWFGDKNVQWAVAMTLDTPNADAFWDITPSMEAVPGGEHDYQYRVSLPFPEAKRVYVRARLSTHNNLVKNHLFTDNDQLGPEYWSNNYSRYGDDAYQLVALYPGQTVACWQVPLDQQESFDPNNPVLALWQIPPNFNSLQLYAKVRLDDGDPNACFFGFAETIGLPPPPNTWGFRLTDPVTLTPGVWTEVTKTTGFVGPYICPVLVLQNPSIHTAVSFADVRINVTSDAGVSLALNDPPHLPLETYGRIYLVSPIVKQGRGH